MTTEELGQKKPLVGRSTDEKTAVAGGIAAAIVIILFVGWALFFFKKVQRGAITPTFDNAAQGQFNFDSVRKAQDELSKTYRTVTDEFRTVREGVGGTFEMQMQETVPQGGVEDVFDTVE
ncbi:hypothetical protein A2673_03330 [Candidatus Kaiserbacteria bacterium RIFCSPHIGHO2_01_FULL_50_13]|uniref:Uncharacterized protein n=1 Tax=Candidatus Kaiserbacteria bacterium RIFCSPLOWO2_01_FULL_50_24 TaxID=1798507 RepID=A0A1F6EIS4_9BACT|nr:MAG: hypothetical protein A2673_03330 [Candidatus Kaiserbacteria bacterium RIFCSPHIGHO2_01_FULL_50_13]OGG73536.1 MAG: hypothetical protein A3A34_01170 [Candidatus Kaiserbacteria bacterium RIFCSPLOWO2_01_FULL_50_24]OGG81584.1 MAG: hypothetical protein A3H74_00705 [Candidatus Kaiserbacteria bacterium RIFCSPLOWO2_02_FULL_51_13]